MSRTITNTGTIGIKLTRPSDNPVTAGFVTASISGGTVGIVIGGDPGTVNNYGTVRSSSAYLLGTIVTGQYSPYKTGSSGSGVVLTGGGTVTNGSGAGSTALALISGAKYGVSIAGQSGTVVNNATISSSSKYFNFYYNPHYYIKASNGVAVALENGGLVVNGAIGNTGALIKGGKTGIAISGSSGTVVNAGTVVAATSDTGSQSLSRSGTGVSLSAGGSVTNGATDITSSVIVGGRYGVEISGQSGVVTNDGTIVASSSFVESLGMEGTSKGFLGDAVRLSAGGQVVNGSSGVTSALLRGGSYGIAVRGGVGTVANFGSIIGFGVGYDPGNGGDYSGGVGISMFGGGVVTNGAPGVLGAIIKGGNVGVEFFGQAGTVINSGTVIGRGPYNFPNDPPSLTGSGVLLAAGGVVTNGASGTNQALITGTKYGVSIAGGPETVINAGVITGLVGIAFGTGASTPKLSNAGTIVGTGGTAVSFAGGNARVDVYPGAVFRGAVVARASGFNVLALDPGTVAGSLGGIGTQFTEFTTVIVDAGARWTLSSINALGQRSALNVSGALTVRDVLFNVGATSIATGGVLLASNGSAVVLSGVTLAGGTLVAAVSADLVVGSTLTGTPNGRLTVENGASITGFGKVGMAGAAAVSDQGSIVAKGGTLELARSVLGSGSLTIASGATLVADQALSARSVAFTSGTGGSLVLGDPARMTSTVSGFGTGDLIDVKAIAATSANFVRGTLQLLDQHHVVVDRISFAGSYTTANFALSSDGQGGTDIRFVAAAMASAARDLTVPVQIAYASEKNPTPVGWIGNGYAAALDPPAAADTAQGWHAANHIRS